MRRHAVGHVQVDLHLQHPAPGRPGGVLQPAQLLRHLGGEPVAGLDPDPAGAGRDGRAGHPHRGQGAEEAPLRARPAGRPAARRRGRRQARRRGRVSGLRRPGPRSALSGPPARPGGGRPRTGRRRGERGGGARRRAGPAAAPARGRGGTGSQAVTATTPRARASRSPQQPDGGAHQGLSVAGRPSPRRTAAGPGRRRRWPRPAGRRVRGWPARQRAPPPRGRR